MDRKIMIDPMPKHCTECPLYVDYGDYTCTCKLIGSTFAGEQAEKERHPKCPLTEV